MPTTGKYEATTETYEVAAEVYEEAMTPTPLQAVAESARLRAAERYGLYVSDYVLPKKKKT